MAKKHLKHLRAEKAKVKLKKKLPKGLNITDTSFKVKKIAIAEQLPDHTGIPTTSKRQTLQECLNYLTHHNVNKQVDGLKGIKELLRGAETGNGAELRQIVTRVMESAVEDKDSKVRRASVKLLIEVLSALPAEARSPFTELLSRQTQRGLSNINSGVQRDSLGLVDLLLNITPLTQLQARRPLISLLLRLLTMTGASAPPRAAVLRRLLATCEAVYALPKTLEAPVREVSWKERLDRPLTSTYHSMVQLPLSVSECGETSQAQVRDNITLLMRAGVGVWTEVSPNQQVVGDVVQILSLLVRLVLLLYRFAARDTESPELKSWFVDSFREQVGRNLLHRFPFQAGASGTKGARQQDFSEDLQAMSPDLLQLNLNLATLYMYIQPRNNLLPHISKFLPSALDVRPVSEELVSLLDALLRVRDRRQSIVADVASSFQTVPDDKLATFLSRVALDQSFEDCRLSPEFQAWLLSLVHHRQHSATLAAMASRGLDESLAVPLRALMPTAMGDTRVDKHLVHAFYWTCPPDALRAAAEHSPQDIKQYVNDILDASLTTMGCGW